LFPNRQFMAFFSSEECTVYVVRSSIFDRRLATWLPLEARNYISKTYMYTTARRREREKLAHQLWRVRLFVEAAFSFLFITCAIRQRRYAEGKKTPIISSSDVNYLLSYVGQKKALCY
jgi:hypothetical protein